MRTSPYFYWFESETVLWLCALWTLFPYYIISHFTIATVVVLSFWTVLYTLVFLFAGVIPASWYDQVNGMCTQTWWWALIKACPVLSYDRLVAERLQCVNSIRRLTWDGNLTWVLMQCPLTPADVQSTSAPALTKITERCSMTARDLLSTHLNWTTNNRAIFAVTWPIFTISAPAAPKIKSLQYWQL